eukprot:2300234-Prymnesium_polylepis.1
MLLAGEVDPLASTLHWLKADGARLPLVHIRPLRFLDRDEIRPLELRLLQPHRQAERAVGRLLRNGHLVLFGRGDATALGRVRRGRHAFQRWKTQTCLEKGHSPKTQKSKHT